MDAERDHLPAGQHVQMPAQQKGFDHVRPIPTSSTAASTGSTRLTDNASKPIDANRSIEDLADAAHLASYAGIAPVTRRSGTSIRGEHPAKGGNKRLKSALFLSAFASLHHGPSGAYYDRRRARGKRHNQAIIALARRRTDVLFAMLRDGTLYQDPTDPQSSSPVALAV